VNPERTKEGRAAREPVNERQMDTQVRPRIAEAPAPLPAGDVLWYKDAIIYEVHVKAFVDSNDDGIGDFPGRTSRLDYLQDLGINTIWLLPFYPSPFRDDGYDVADYHNVHPAYGAREDFRCFVREAHKRGLRVITELVVNHTSDQHPWFQAARRAPKGSPKRNFYVWSDSPDKYAGTRIIFTDTEKSNWTWDEVAQQYYWHRFFHHQPDLNFDNPQVLKAVVRTMRFWLDMGVDGFRLDAIPYLVEREGTSNENLPETHAVIRKIRSALGSVYADRLLLAEANQWPEDVAEYFGAGDQCHMAYHFPLMPRMYMALAQEDRHPIVEIMAQTPEIPDICQWAIFLRNHDELTLEMVTGRERDYMYRMYAADKRARIAGRQVHLVLENDGNQSRYLGRDAALRPMEATAQWNDDVHHAIHVLVSGERDGYYADYADRPLWHLGRCLAEGFAYQGEPSAYRGHAPRGEPSAALPPAAFVALAQTHDQVGNRAFGERIECIADPRRLRAVLACVLLAPAPPMLFMGEEFAATAPFLFFCDFGSELAAAVTRGRRSEFARFERFRDPAAQQTIPDPNDPATFERSRLDWTEPERPPHSGWLALYRELLALRHRHIVPRLKGMRSGGTFDLPQDDVLRVRWMLGDGSRLHLLANLAAAPCSAVEVPAGEVVYASGPPGEAARTARNLPACAAVVVLEPA
jgi:glycosidase